MCRLGWLIVFLAITPTVSLAGEADVLKVEVVAASGGAFSFHVTVAHEDSGWDHYADKWQVIGPGGAVLGERVLLHPHVNEQPFTRSLSGVLIPEGINSVTLRAGDNVHDFGGKEIEISLPGR